MKLYFYLAPICLLLNCSSPNYEIKKVQFHAGVCFGTCPDFTITINEDRSAVYEAKIYNPTKGVFKTTIHQEQFDSLKMLIMKSNFFQLKNEYTVQITDLPSFSLTVQQASGQTKTIEDYGASGPDKLTKIYDFISSLRISQDWK